MATSKKKVSEEPRIPYREYKEARVREQKMYSGHISQTLYEQIHKVSIIPCHDVFIKTTYNGKSGYLLVKRKKRPAKNDFFPIGGRILKGYSAETSLQKKVSLECSLKLKNIRLLGVARTLFSDGPFKHTKGTDTLNLIYSAEGIGKLVLDKNHEEPVIITKQDYKKRGESFHPYVHDGLKYIDEHDLW